MTNLENSWKLDKAIQYWTFNDVKALFNEWLNINDTDYEWRTALMMYCFKWDIQAVLELIWLWADVNKFFLYQNRIKMTALDAARESKKSEVEKILLNHGAKTGKEIL